MGVNEFLSYATDGVTPNVQALASYAVDPIREDGAQQGEAQAPQANRAWRQSANMASALGSLIINKTNLDALDDGNLATLRDTLAAMIAACAPPIPKQQYPFSSSTTFVVPANTWRVEIEIVGGGAGGGGCTNGQGGAGGGAGGYAHGVFAVTPGDVLTITVGAAGTAGAANSGNGGNGGNTTVVCAAAGISMSAAGGTGGGGSGPGNTAGGAPGNSAGGQITLYGGWGEDGQSATCVMGGMGGCSFFGGGGRGASGGGSPTDALAPGSGGGGSYQTSSPGGAGAAGLVIVRI